MNRINLVPKLPRQLPQTTKKLNFSYSLKTLLIIMSLSTGMALLVRFIWFPSSSQMKDTIEILIPWAKVIAALYFAIATRKYLVQRKKHLQICQPKERGYLPF